jgi:cell division protein FtsL
VLSDYIKSILAEKIKINMTYSSSLSVNRQSYTKRNQNAVSFRSREKVLGPVSNTIILVVLACLLGLLYLTQVTKTNSYGNKVFALEQQQSQLQNQHQNLEVSSAQLQSLNRVQDSAVSKSLAPVTPSTTINN